MVTGGIQTGSRADSVNVKCRSEAAGMKYMMMGALHVHESTIIIIIMYKECGESTMHNNT